MKKIALVTGSSRGIGLAAAKELENAGCQVIYHASKVSDKLLAAAGNSPFFGVDLSDAEAVGTFADELISQNMVPDILVLNASYQSYTGIGNFAESEYRKMFDTNVLSTGILLNKLFPEMQKKNYGRIIFVSSVNGVKPAGRLAVYGATKAAFQNLARTANLTLSVMVLMGSPVEMEKTQISETGTQKNDLSTSLHIIGNDCGNCRHHAGGRSCYGQFFQFAFG